tara:strand:- start:300 stop:434 length:135 start_codon:yes stop_codon:yes gene_type:complete
MNGDKEEREIGQGLDDGIIENDLTQKMEVILNNAYFRRPTSSRT